MRKLTWGVCAAVLLAGAPAFAQSWVPREVDVVGGLGFGAFSQGLGDVTGTGFGWNARVGAEFLPVLGGEIMYQGLNGDVNTIINAGGQGGAGRVLDNQGIRQHQFTANARVGAPLEIRGQSLKPYGLVGLGYSRLNSNDTLAAVGLPSDNQFAIPLGVGASYGLTDNLMIDGRFTYNILTGVDLPIADDSADSWTALVNVGTRFGL
jgi:opacity protein-like surface antigen